jgi:hypothetical protein
MRTTEICLGHIPSPRGQSSEDLELGCARPGHVLDWLAIQNLVRSQSSEMRSDLAEAA